METSRKIRTTRKHDFAYGCFLIIGFTSLFSSIISAIPMDTGLAGGLGFLVLLPLSVASLVAMFVGVFLSLTILKHWPLLFLSIFSLLFLLEIITEAGSVSFYNTTGWVYGIITTGFSIGWFLFIRKKYK